MGAAAGRAERIACLGTGYRHGMEIVDPLGDVAAEVGEPPGIGGKAAHRRADREAVVQFGEMAGYQFGSLRAGDVLAGAGRRELLAPGKGAASAAGRAARRPLPLRLGGQPEAGGAGIAAGDATAALLIERLQPGLPAQPVAKARGFRPGHPDHRLAHQVERIATGVAGTVAALEAAVLGVGDLVGAQIERPPQLRLPLHLIGAPALFAAPGAEGDGGVGAEQVQGAAAGGFDGCGQRGWRR